VIGLAGKQVKTPEAQWELGSSDVSRHPRVADEERTCWSGISSLYSCSVASLTKGRNVEETVWPLLAKHGGRSLMELLHDHFDALLSMTHDARAWCTQP
jgi:hypothetical protein